MPLQPRYETVGKVTVRQRKNVVKTYRRITPPAFRISSVAVVHTGRVLAEKVVSPSSNRSIQAQTVEIEAVLHSPDARRVLRRNVVFCVGFLALTALCFHRKGPTSIDRLILNGYVPKSSSMVFRISNFYTSLGSPGVVIVLGVLAAVCVRFRHGSVAWAVACLAAPGIAGVVESTLKIAIARQRPISAVLSGESGNGFPSGHAAGFSAFALTVAFVFATRGGTYRVPLKLFLVAGIASALMALTRVLVGAHYPTDVFGGLLVGVVSADITAFMARHSDTLWGVWQERRRNQGA